MTDNILIDKNQEAIETWAYIEIMGHSRIAGRVSERKAGTQVMYQIDVPKAEEGFSHSVLYSPAAIFSIQPTTEEWCRRWIASHRSSEVLPYIPPTRQLQPKEETVFPPNQEELDEEEKYREIIRKNEQEAHEDEDYFCDDISEEDIDL